MPPPIATFVFAIGILGLFALDRDPEDRTSIALWIPVLWLLINGSRAVSQWMNTGPVVSSTETALEGSPFDALVYAVLLLVGLVVMFSRGRQFLAILRSNGALVLFFSYCVISVLWSDFPFVAFKRWTKELGDLVMVLIVLTDPDRSTAIKRLMARTGFVLLPVSLLLIKYYPALGRGYDPWEGTMRIVGVTTNKNALGMVCLVVGLGAMWRLLKVYRTEKSKLRTKQLFAQGVLVGLALWLLSTTNSMTSISCFALAGTMMLITSLPAVARRRPVIHFLVFMLLFVAASPLFLAFGSGFMEMLGRDSTLTGRTDIWRAVLSFAGNPFFGAGFESFWLGERVKSISSAFYYIVNSAHNGYLEVYINLGWVGITLLAATAMAGYKDIIRSFQQDQDAAKLRLAFFIVGLAYSVTEAGFRMMSLTWIFFLFAVTRIPTNQAPQVTPEWQPEPLQMWRNAANPVHAKANKSATI